MFNQAPSSWGPAAVRQDQVNGIADLTDQLQQENAQLRAIVAELLMKNQVLRWDLEASQHQE